MKLTSGEVCFGSRVELICTHPDPFDDPVKYLQISITWAMNGTTIDFSDPASERFTLTRLNSTASTLSFDITEEDHRDRVILCSCFLVRNNANRDRDESEPLVLNPPGVYLYISLLCVDILFSCDSLTVLYHVTEVNRKVALCKVLHAHY